MLVRHHTQAVGCLALALIAPSLLLVCSRAPSSPGWKYGTRQPPGRQRSDLPLHCPPAGLMGSSGSLAAPHCLQQSRGGKPAAGSGAGLPPHHRLPGEAWAPLQIQGLPGKRTKCACLVPAPLSLKVLFFLSITTITRIVN